jgi:actin-related protein
MGGRDLDDYFKNLSMKRYSWAESGDDWVICSDMKEKLCYVALNFEEEMKKSSQSSNIEKFYELPDGNKVVYNDERFKIPEVFFQPKFFGSETSGIHELIFNSIMNCDVDLRKEFFSNIFLFGGSSMFDGFDKRIENELIPLAAFNTIIKCNANPERKYSSWIGGSVLGVLNYFNDICVSKEEYEEFGPLIIHKKCF